MTFSHEACIQSNVDVYIQQSGNHVVVNLVISRKVDGPCLAAEILTFFGVHPKCSLMANPSYL